MVGADGSVALSPPEVACECWGVEWQVGLDIGSDAHGDTGMIGAVDPLGSLLEELSDELGGGFKNGGAQQFFQIGHDTAAGLGGAEGGNQLLDFFFLGKGIALGVRRFFLTPAFRSCRETSEIPATCSSTSFIKCS